MSSVMPESYGSRWGSSINCILISNVLDVFFFSKSMVWPYGNKAQKRQDNLEKKHESAGMVSSVFVRMSSNGMGQDSLSH